MGESSKPGAVPEYLHQRTLITSKEPHLSGALNWLTMKYSRRNILKSLGVLPLLLATKRVNSALLNPMATSRVQCSVNAYSFNKQLRSGEMSWLDMMEFAAEIGLDAVDLTGYYFPSYPEVPSDEELFYLKRAALKLGLDISWTGVRNDFVTSDASSRKADLKLIHDWLQASSRLGAPVMRIFAGKNSHQGLTREQAKSQLVEELKICASYGAETGVLPALQHHNDFLFTSEEVIDILHRVDSDWLGLILDVGSLRTGDPYQEIEKLAPYADYWFIKEFVYFNEKATPIDMDKVARILKNTNYQGYVSFESLADGDPKEIVTRMYRSFKEAYNKL
jgi:sugar phosphate isomerase/epimerase